MTSAAARGPEHDTEPMSDEEAADLVNGLRHSARHAPVPDCSYMEEAADEIVALRAALASTPAPTENPYGSEPLAPEADVTRWTRLRCADAYADEGFAAGRATTADTDPPPPAEDSAVFRGRTWFVADARWDENPDGIGSHWHLTLTGPLDERTPPRPHHVRPVAGDDRALEPLGFPQVVPAEPVPPAGTYRASGDRPADTDPPPATEMLLLARVAAVGIVIVGGDGRRWLCIGGDNHIGPLTDDECDLLHRLEGADADALDGEPF